MCILVQQCASVLTFLPALIIACQVFSNGSSGLWALPLAMVDRTRYVDKLSTPDLALRQIFGRQKVPSSTCLLFAAAGLLNVDTVATLGDSHASVRASFTILAGGEENLGATPRDREMCLVQAVAVWKSSCALKDCFDTRRAKMEEDPHKIPALGQEDHGDFRARFVEAHPDSVLTNKNEPHRRFVERLNRDFTVNGCVPFYEVGEIRLRCETIAQKSGMAPSADQLVKMVKEDVMSSSVGTEEEVLQRLHAFFMALEYLNICTFNVADGPVTYLKELQHFRQRNSGLEVLLKADKFIRQKVAELNTDERDIYGTFSEALLHVIQHCRYLWNDARTDAEVQRLETTFSSPVRAGKRAALDDESERGAATPRITSSAKKRQRLKAKLASPGPKPPVQVQKGSGKGSAPAKSGSGDSNRVPDNEWKQILAIKVKGKPRCKFFNSSKGCTAGEKCSQEHRCLTCGGEHAWFSNCRK